MGELVMEREHKDRPRRNSTGKVTPRGSASPARTDEKPLPHYLMPSTNSCHDFCKYGHKHVFEDDEKHPIRPNVLGNSRSPIHDQSQVKSLTVRERITGKGNKAMTQSKLNAALPDKPKVREKRVMSPSQEIGSSEETSEQESIALSLDKEQDILKSPTPVDIKKKQVIGLPKVQRRTYVKSKVVEQKDLSAGNDNYDSEDSRDINGMKRKTTTIKKTDIPSRPLLVKQKSRSFVRIPSLTSRTRTFRPKAPLSSEEIEESSESPISLKPKTSTLNSASPVNSSEDVFYERNQEKTAKSVLKPKITQKKELKPLTASLSPAPPVSKPRQYIKRIASVKKRNVGKVTIDSKKIKEKPSASIQESTSQGGEDKAKLKRTKTVRLEDDSASPYKLKFSNGKVIDLPPESSAPIKLRFSRGRVVDNSNSNAGGMWRRSFSRKSSRRRGLTGVVYNDPNTGGQVVVLRHQDVQKKDDQGLFNNVIEETATKLVKSRKSKVKALVGAFENVISSIRGGK